MTRFHFMKKISKSISEFVAGLRSSKLRITNSATISGLVAGIYFFWILSLILEDVDPQFGLQLFFLGIYSSAIFTAGFIFFWSLLYILHYFAGDRSARWSAAMLVLSFVLLAGISHLSYIFGRPHITRIFNAKAASSSSTSSATLEALYQKALSPYDDDIIRNLAENPASPPDLLAKLSKEQDFSIRCRVARNPNASLEIIEQLSADSHPDVRASTAGNPKVTDDIILKLCEDKNERVRKYVNYFAKQRGLKTE